jgi:hypothetical protein
MTASSVIEDRVASEIYGDVLTEAEGTTGFYGMVTITFPRACPSPTWPIAFAASRSG